jgi:WD40 repeat protein
VVLIDPAAGKELWQWQAHKPHLEGTVYKTKGIRFCPDNRTLLTFGTDTNSAQVWDSLTRQSLHELKHEGTCNNVQFSPDGQLVATTGLDKLVRVWVLATGAPVTKIDHPDWVFAAVFSPDGKHLLTACRDGMARLWDWREGRLVCPPFKHEHEVGDVAFTPDGRHVLTVSHDGVLQISECRTGKLVCPPLPLGGAGLSLAVTPDGKRVACGGFVNDLPVFHLDDWLAEATLEADDLCLWGELVSGQRIEAGGGGVTNLTDQEWLDRWRDFRARHPERATAP